MNPEAARVRRTYLLLTLFSTLASSFIWGINTLFLLSAGLNNTEAFTVNAFFSAGQLLFEVPTGVVADTRGRRFSYLMGTVTLILSTLLYFYMWQTTAPLWGWAVSSVFLGLGFTFFSGATEAWLVDALGATGYEGPLEGVFARAQVVGGAAMLAGAAAGGFIAQVTSLGVPYLIRAGFLVVTLVIAWRLMHDLGFTRMPKASVGAEVKTVVTNSVRTGFGNRPIRWLILSSPFLTGVSFFGFYALQPYLLDLYGDQNAFGIAGAAAALFAGAQIVGGLVVPWIQKRIRRRTGAILLLTGVATTALAMIGLLGGFWVVVGFAVIWAIAYSAAFPIRQAFLNGCIPSAQRATILSLDSLAGSGGGAVVQPVLGRVADVSGYPASFLASAVVQALALPFIYLARREDAAGEVVPAPSRPQVRIRTET